MFADPQAKYCFFVWLNPNLCTMSFAALWCTCDMPTQDSKGQSCTGIKGCLFHKHICALVLCTPQLTLQWFCGVIDCEVIRADFKLLFLLQSGPVHPLTWNLEGMPTTLDTSNGLPLTYRLPVLAEHFSLILTLRSQMPI